jgi:hypothetical protein
MPKWHYTHDLLHHIEPIDLQMQLYLGHLGKSVTIRFIALSVRMINPEKICEHFSLLKPYFNKMWWQQDE